MKGVTYFPASAFAGAHAEPPSSAEAELRTIRRRLGVIMWVHSVSACLNFALMVTVTALVGAAISQYYAPVSRVFTPERAAEAAHGALVIVGNARNITSDIAFFADAARALAAGGAAVSSEAGAAAGRRALLQAGLSPDVQAAAAALLGALAAKVESADMNAPSDFLRYVMALPWRQDIAPRIDRGIASVQYAELIAGAALGALASANGTARQMLHPPKGIEKAHHA